MSSPNWLIAWTFSPIQPFISTTRKGRDLWYASWLLSDVARRAALAAHQAGGDLLSPGDPDRLGNDRYSIANKVLVLVEGEREAALGIAQKMSRALKDRLAELSECLIDRIARDGELPAYVERRGEGRVASFDHGRIREQIADALQDTWVIVPVSPTPRGVVEAREDAERLLTATKTARGFTQPPWSATIPKASVDGEREAVLEQALYDKDRRKERAPWMQRLDLRPGEQVCGVTLLKRKGPTWLSSGSTPRVESTSHFAAIPFLRQFHDRQATWGDAWENFVAAVKSSGGELASLPRAELLPVVGHYDAHLLYPTRLHDIAWPGRTLDARERDVMAPQDVLDAHADLMRALREARKSLQPEDIGPPAPSPYYAVLMADGDRIGETLRRAASREDLKEGIGKLDRFCQQTPTIIQLRRLPSGLLPEGQCIYAGGDDVLAFLPVDTALEVAHALHEAFKKEWGDAAEAPTLSVAIVIAHHLTPLQETLDAARDAESKAKQVFKRNAWVVDLRKRGGAPILVGGKWEVPSEDTDRPPDIGSAATWIGMKRFIQDYRHRHMPRGLPHELRDLAEALGEERLVDPTRKVELPIHVQRAVQALLAQKDTQRSGWTNPDGAAAHVLTSCRAVGLRSTAERLIVARALTGLDAEDE